MSTPTDPTAGEGLVKVLAQHRYVYGQQAALLCRCGEPDPSTGNRSDAHRRHLATLLAARESAAATRARAEALREAADALNTTDHATEAALVGIDHAIDWLRDRADALAPDTAGESA